MKIFKVTKRFLISLIAINIFFVFLCGAGLFFIKRENEKASTMSNDIIELSKREQSIKSLKIIMRDSAEKRTLLDSYFLKQEDLIGFLDTLSVLARESGLTLAVDKVNIKDSLTGGSANTEILELNLKTEGSWIGNYHFLSYLETLPFHVIFDNISLNSAGTVSKSGVKKSVWQGALVIRLLKAKDIKMEDAETKI